MERIILGYNGDLETSIAIPWLAERYNAEIVAVAVDVGQRTELVAIRERALALGAKRCHVIDAREEFVRDYVVPTLKAGALRDGSPMPVALGKPLIVRKLIDIARMEGAAAIAHGSTAATDDAIRIERASRAIAPFLTVLTPTQTWDMDRAQQIEYARGRNIPASVVESGAKIDANVWGRSIELGADDEASDEIYTLTRAPQHCPDQPAYVEVELKAGVPVRANGIEMPLLEMIDSLETIAGAHGVGRIDTGQAPSGSEAKAGHVRHLYEAPAAVVLHAAHRAVQSLAISPELAPVIEAASRAYATVVDEGTWFSPTREALDALVSAIQPRVTGTVKLELLKGTCRAIEAGLSDQPERVAAENLIEGR
jgi:argininosuccinate synthase